MNILAPPDSMWFLILLSTIVAIASALLTKLLVDTKELQRKQVQLKSHQDEKKKVIEMAEIDIEKYHKMRKKWERRDAILKKTQQGMAMQRLKPTCITFLPMIIIFAIMRFYFENDPVAYTPMNPSLWGYADFFVRMGLANGELKTDIGTFKGINFTAWYFICSLGINTIIQRLSKLQTQASGGMEQMFGGQKGQSLQFPDI